MPAEVTVVIVTYNSAHVIDGLLDSLPAALDGLTAETVVVDNASADTTVEIVQRRADCRLVEAPNLGYAAGINRGVAASTGTGPVLVLNPDIRLAPGSVKAMVAALAQPRTGVVVPRVLDTDGRLVPSMRREPTWLRNLGLGSTGLPLFAEYVDDPAAYDRPQTCDWALGAALLVDRECHRQLVGWDASYFLYSEETDFCLRARDAGWLTRYAPTAVVTHIGGQSGRSGRTHAMQVLNRVRLYRRRHGLPAATAYYLFSILGEVSWLLRGNQHCRASIRALLLRSARPPELGLSTDLIPR